MWAGCTRTIFQTRVGLSTVIAMEYAQRVYDGEYDTAGEALRKANLSVHYKQIDSYLNILRELD